MFQSDSKRGREKREQRQASFRQRRLKPKKKHLEFSYVGLVDLPSHHLPHARAADPGPARVRQLQPCLQPGIQNVLRLLALNRDFFAARADKGHDALAAVVDGLVSWRRDDVAAELVCRDSSCSMSSPGAAMGMREAASMRARESEKVKFSAEFFRMPPPLSLPTF